MLEEEWVQLLYLKFFNFFKSGLLVLFSVFITKTVLGSEYNNFLQWLEAPYNVDSALQNKNYSQQNLSELAVYFAPGYFEELDFDDVEIEVKKEANYQPHEFYIRATKKYQKEVGLEDNKLLSNYKAGKPFSDEKILKAEAGQAGLMVAWNNVMRWQYFGYASDITTTFIRPSAPGKNGRLLKGMRGSGDVFRHTTNFYQRVYISGLSSESEQNMFRMPVDGSDRLLYKEFIEVFSPYDMAGLKIVIERPIDQYKGDQVNSYLPNERRVRRLSAKERADSYIGTNWTLDDFEGFSGMVVDNEWKLIGEKKILSILDSQQEYPKFHGRLSAIPIDTWQLRDCYVIEATPIWTGHPYGKRVLFVDKISGTIPLSLVYNRNGKLWKIFQIVYQLDEDRTDVASSTPKWRASSVINKIDNTANTAIAIGPTKTEKISASKFKRIFSVSNLTEGR